VVLIRGKKGMASVIDVMMFITVIALVAAGMFAYSSLTHDETTEAKTLHDAFFSIELRTNDLFNETDTQSVRMCDLVAAHMMSGRGDVREYTEHVLASVIPPIYGYEFTFEYEGRVMTVGNGGYILTSQYSSEMVILGGKMMRTSLSLY
jgi:hypothetical protein